MHILEILENQVALLDDFIRLNEEWITRYFKIEDVDRELAANPIQVFEDGGYIFSLINEGNVQGVCALFNNGDGVFELARMAVTPGSQGKGYGKALILHALTKLQTIEAKQVYLVSNTKLTAAIELYKSYGFKTVSEGQHPVYTRANIVMSRELT